MLFLAKVVYGYVLFKNAFITFEIIWIRVDCGFLFNLFWKMFGLVWNTSEEVGFPIDFLSILGSDVSIAVDGILLSPVGI